MNKYWFENALENDSWQSLWSNYIICWTCGGIRKDDGLCTVCKSKLKKSEKIKVKSEDGKDIEISSNTFMGAEGQLEDYVFLNMMEAEWRRPASDYNQYTFLNKEKRPSSKAIIVLVFWTYFETRVERLLIKAMADLPVSISENFLKRHQSISSRLNELYKILFGKKTSYFLDLKTLGFQNIEELLFKVKNCRNEFMHGNPEAINDELVETVVSLLKEEHKSWIAVYNLRAIKKTVANTG